jgi:OmcA/MtrC family decaheme c-type cytochrome
MDHPSALVCTSCHSDVDFVTGEGHPGGAQADDSKCGNCHRPTGSEFGRSVSGAHTQLYKSSQLPGLQVNILAVTNTFPGAKPTVKFTVGSRDSALDPGSLNRLLFSISGPNTDFSYYVQETVGTSAVNVGDAWTYTFKAALPKTAKGSYTVGVEGRNTVMIDTGGDAPASVSDMAQDSTFAFAVTDAVAVPRRTVVADYNCESCHNNLSLHGENRNNTDYCVTCHQPGATDAPVRPASELPTQSIHFKYMIHKIHTGAELENGYLVYGYRSILWEEAQHIEYPGDRRNCKGCHVDDSYQLPPPAGVLATTTNYDLWTPTQPMAAACLSCHDDDGTASHAFANTTVFGESCTTCHGVDKDFAVDKVHAQ